MKTEGEKLNVLRKRKSREISRQFSLIGGFHESLISGSFFPFCCNNSFEKTKIQDVQVLLEYDISRPLVTREHIPYTGHPTSIYDGIRSTLHSRTSFKNAEISEIE